MICKKTSNAGIVLVARSLTMVIGIAALSAGYQLLAADEAPSVAAASRAAGFRALLDRRQRETLRSVADYVASHPDADDAEQASLWMFETASAQGLEAEVVAPAEQFLKRRGLDQPSISLAQQAPAGANRPARPGAAAERVLPGTQVVLLGTRAGPGVDLKRAETSTAILVEIGRAHV